MTRAFGVARGARRQTAMWLVACLIGAFTAPTLQAQSSIPAPGPCDTGTSNNGACRMHLVFTTTIQPTRALSVVPSSDFALLPASGQLDASDFDAGFFDVAGKLTLAVSSTTAWRVTVQSTSGAMTGSCASRPASSIQWGLTAGSRAIPLSSTPIDVASGGTYVVNRQLDLYFRVSLDWLRDGPVTAANCTLPLAFTVTSP